MSPNTAQLSCLQVIKTHVSINKSSPALLSQVNIKAHWVLHPWPNMQPQRHGQVYLGKMGHTEGDQRRKWQVGASWGWEAGDRYRVRAVGAKMLGEHIGSTSVPSPPPASWPPKLMEHQVFLPHLPGSHPQLIPPLPRRTACESLISHRDS